MTKLKLETELRNIQVNRCPLESQEETTGEYQCYMRGKPCWIALPENRIQCQDYRTFVSRNGART